MGGYMSLYSSEFSLYSRSKTTNYYNLEHEFKEGNPMSRFKHEVYKYALRRAYPEAKAVYLYCGYSRVAKAMIHTVSDVKYLNVEFSNDEAAKEWDDCQEQMDKVYIDIVWLEKPFQNSWCYHVEENFQIRKYQNYKQDMKN